MKTAPSHDANSSIDHKRIMKTLHSLGQSTRSENHVSSKQPIDGKQYGNLTAAVRTHLQNEKLPIRPENRIFRKLWQDKSKTLIVQDLEFMNSASFSPRSIVEICWSWYNEDNNDWEVFQSTINHGISVQQMYDIYNDGPQSHINRGILRKIYGEPSEQQTQGMTIQELADRLETIVAGQEIWLAEWSTSYCDYSLLSKTLNEIGKSHILPARGHVFSVLHAWQFALRGMSVRFQLSVLHGLVVPFDSHLIKLAHRAEADVRMTINLMVIYFQGTLKPLAPTGIKKYFGARKKYVVEEDIGSGDLLVSFRNSDHRQRRDVAGDEEDSVGDDLDDFSDEDRHESETEGEES